MIDGRWSLMLTGDDILGRITRCGYENLARPRAVKQEEQGRDTGLGMGSPYVLNYHESVQAQKEMERLGSTQPCHKDAYRQSD
jgi:hypothetical protein